MIVYVMAQILQKGSLNVSCHDVIELLIIFGDFIVNLISLVLDLIDRETKK